MRSAPPCSSPFAEMPVPAPAPMIGSPRAFMARKRARMSERGIRGMALPSCPPAGEAPTDKPAEFGYDFRREPRVVDVRARPDEAARTCLLNSRFKRAEQLLVGIWIR